MQRLTLSFILVWTLALGLPAAPLKALFFSGGGMTADTGHNGRMNHRKLIPDFLRSGIDLTFSDRLEDLNPETLAQYEAVLMYRGGAIGKPERIDHIINYVENGGGLVAIHHTCGAFDGAQEFISLIGGEFARHGSGIFTATHVPGQEGHPALGGIEPFSTWDETYVHKNLNNDRTDLQVRDEKGRPESWTWVRDQGKGRVFYTAYGHDGRTWEKPGFQKMITAATIWATDRTPPANEDLPTFTYTLDVEGRMHDFENRPEPQRIQDQITAEESAKCLVLPDGFEAQLVAHEPDIMNPVDITWDDQGRMYVAVTTTYPKIDPSPTDRIILCEDSDGDGQADDFTTFAEGFSILTAISWINGGIIAAQAPNMYFLQDTDGDKVADTKRIINQGWGLGDLHGGPSNMKYGFDNRIYGCIGGGGNFSEDHNFRAGIWRMNIDGTRFTPISHLGDNSWGLSISEDFELFASSANRGPAKHVYAPYPYFDALGFKKSPAASIADSATIYPLTLTRQGDHFGSYTSATSFDVYTARSFPREFWNKIGFVGSPTGKLLGQFNLEPDHKGSYIARNQGSFIASFDEHTAPIGGKIGPDGAVYMLDWNNLIMLHGGEINSPFRDRTHGRIYRITHKEGSPSRQYELQDADTSTLLEALQSDNLFWRIMAQQKLVQGSRIDAIPELVRLAQDRRMDAAMLNTTVIHALWALHGLGQLDGSNSEALSVAHAALKHPSAGVRKNAVRVLPITDESTALLVDMLNEPDANTLRNILLTLSTMPASDELGPKLYELKAQIGDRHALLPPFNLALIRHGTSLVDQLIAQCAPRDREQESVPEPEPEMVNILRNPSFEDANEKGLPADWISKVHNGKAALSIDSSVARTGSNSARATSSVGGGSEFLQIPYLEPGEYLLTGWFKTENIEGNNGVLFKALGGGMEDQQTRGVTGTTDDWQQLQLNFKVDRGHGVLIFCLFGAWAPATGTVWFDDISLYQISSTMPKVVEAAAVETVLAKQSFAKGAEEIIRITELVSTRSQEKTAVFMAGLTDLHDIEFTEAQVQQLKALAAAASPENQQHLAVFAANNSIDIGLSELANSIQGFSAELLEGDAERGQLLTAACVICHAPDFNGVTEQRTPPLTALADWYLQAQLQKFKHGVRGYDVSDSDGYLMKELMAGYSHQQIADIATYIKTHPHKPQTNTLGGDPVKGKALYSSCIACHQADGSGNQELDSPALRGLSDSYIVNQLVKFKDGTRGSYSGDQAGKLMQLSAQVLPDEQAMKDVAAYILTLKNGEAP